MNLEPTLLSKETLKDGTIRSIIKIPGVVKLLGHVFELVEANLTPLGLAMIYPITPDGVTQTDELLGSHQPFIYGLPLLCKLINQLPQSPTQKSWWLPTGSIGYNDGYAFYTYEPSPGIMMSMGLPYQLKEVTLDEYYIELLFCETSETIYNRPYSSN